MKLPEASSYTFCGGNVVCVSVHLFFFRCLSFSPTLVAASISHFLTTAIKFSYYSSKENGLFSFFISRSSSFSVIDVNVDIKIK